MKKGPRWLDGRTADGTVGVAATTEPPFTGTKWEVVPIDQPSQSGTPQSEAQGVGAK
jgi:hypothetical protein